MKFALVVSGVRGHRLLHGLGWQYFHAIIGHTPGVECQMLDEDIVGDSGRIAELNFDRYAVFDNNQTGFLNAPHLHQESPDTRAARIDP